MKQDIKERWVAALRSGEYKQGDGQLRCISDSSSSHCCLGVLTDLAARDGVVAWGKEAHSDLGFAPEPVAQWAGLPAWHDEDVQEHLAVMNDSGEPFTTIADYIEDYL